MLQEAMLKEELRNMERMQKREGVDLTYLKNVILKLLETGIFVFIVLSSPAAPSSFMIDPPAARLPYVSQNLVVSLFNLNNSLLFSFWPITLTFKTNWSGE